VRPEATSACFIGVPNMRLMRIGIKKEMAPIGSHFFKKVDFKFNHCYTALFIIFLRHLFILLISLVHIDWQGRNNQ
jgi:hypothetical protein